MDTINEFFKNIATKIKLPTFFKGNTFIFNNLFLALIVLVLVIALILVIVLVPGKKKGKKGEEDVASEDNGAASAAETAAPAKEEAPAEPAPAKEEAPAEKTEEDIAPAAEEPQDAAEPAVEEAAAPAEEEPAEIEIVSAEEKEEAKEEKPAPAAEEKKAEEKAVSEEAVSADKADSDAEKKAPAKKAKKPAAEPDEADKTEVAAAKDGEDAPKAKPARAKKAAEGKNLGKYEIVEREGAFYFLLKANNGQLLAESPSYTTEAGAKKAIETFKNAVVNGQWSIDEDKNGNFRFMLKASARSQIRYYGESYSTRQSAEGSIQSVKNFAENAVIKVVEDTDGEAAAQNDSATVFTPDPLTEESHKAGGKYEITERSGSYFFVLKANNGQLLLESPSYTSELGAKNGIETFKKAAENGIYTIDEDKNGNFKFILRASARSQIRYFGESYATRQRAESSVNSVRSFAQKAVLKKPE